MLEHHETFIFDKRSFSDHYLDYIKYEHPFISLFTNKSLKEPILLRIAMLFFSMSLNFSLNAVFYTDDGIEAEGDNIISALNDSKELQSLKV